MEHHYFPSFSILTLELYVRTRTCSILVYTSWEHAVSPSATLMAEGEEVEYRHSQFTVICTTVIEQLGQCVDWSVSYLLCPA